MGLVQEGQDKLDAMRYRALRDALVGEVMIEIDAERYIDASLEEGVSTASFDAMIDAWMQGRGF